MENVKALRQVVIRTCNLLHTKHKVVQKKQIALAIKSS